MAARRSAASPLTSASITINKLLDNNFLQNTLEPKIITANPIAISSSTRNTVHHSNSTPVMSAFIARIAPGAGFNKDQSHLQWIPVELREEVYGYIVASDEFVVTTKDARGGVTSRVLSGPAQNGGASESTFSFSSTYASGISNKSSLHEYRWHLQDHIIHKAERILVNVKNLQFANAVKLLTTLEKSGELPKFLRRPNVAGMPHARMGVRRFFIMHHITKDFSGSTDAIVKWSKRVKASTPSGRMYSIDHEFRLCSDADLEVVGQCLADLGAFGAYGRVLEIDSITRQMGKSLSAARASEAIETFHLRQEDSQAQSRLEAFDEQGRQEAAHQLLLAEMDEYEDNDVTMESDEEMSEEEGQASWGSLRAGSWSTMVSKVSAASRTSTDTHILAYWLSRAAWPRELLDSGK